MLTPRRRSGSRAQARRDKWESVGYYALVAAPSYVRMSVSGPVFVCATPGCVFSPHSIAHIPHHFGELPSSCHIMTNWHDGRTFGVGVSERYETKRNGLSGRTETARDVGLSRCELDGRLGRSRVG